MQGRVNNEGGSNLPAVMEEIWIEALGHERARNPGGAANAYAAYLIFQLAAGQPFDLHVVDRLARSLEQLGDVVEAIRALSAVRNQARATGDRYADTFMVLRMAQVAITAGEPASAERWLADVTDARGRWEEPRSARAPELLARAAALAWPGLDAADLALIRMEATVALARLWACRGRYAAASQAVQQALIINGAEVFHARSELSLFLAELQLDSGDFNKAQEVLQQSAPRPGEEGRLKWEVLRVQGLLMAGRFGKARAVALQALEAEEPEPRAALHLRWLLSQAAVLLNRSAEAEKSIAAALEQISAGAAFRGWAARFTELRELNERRAGLGGTDWEPAKLPEQVLEIGAEAGEDAPEDGHAASSAEPQAPSLRRERFIDEWAGRTLRVQRALAAGQLERASERLAELEALGAETDSEFLQARTRYFSGLVAYARGAYSQALEAFSVAREQALRGGLVMYAWESQRALSWAYARLGNAEEHTRHAAEARTLLDSIVAGLDPRDAVYFSLNKWTARDEYVASRVQALERFEPPRLPLPWLQEWWSRHMRSRATAQVLRELNALVSWRVERLLSPTGPVLFQAYQSHQSVDPDDASTAAQVARWIEARQAQAQRSGGKRTRWNPEGPVAGWPWKLPRRMAVLQFHVLADRLLVFLVTRREIRCQTFPGVTRIRLRQLAEESLASIQEQSAVRGRAQLERLAKLIGLQETLGGLGAEVDRLVVVPSDVLVNVPFAALPYGEGWLCDRFAVSLLPHASMFSQALGRKARPLQSKRFVGVGVRHYPGEKLRELPRAVEEVEEAARHLAPNQAQTILRDGEAQPEAILQALQSADWAHFACHGRVESSDMLSTRLHVAGAEGKPGRLTLAELQLLPLEKLNGMVLAACWLSSTLFLPGHEQVGLPAALMRAGVGTVIASLWEVDDEANFQFMARFYALARERGAVWALREVQREWVRREDGWALPFHWASYVLYGGA